MRIYVLLVLLILGLQIPASSKTLPSVKVHFLDSIAGDQNLVFLSADSELQIYADPEGALSILLLHQKIFSNIQRQLYQKRISIDEVRKQKISNWQVLKDPMKKNFSRLEGNQKFKLRSDVEAFLKILNSANTPSYGDFEAAGWFQLMDSVAQLGIYRYDSKAKKTESQFLKIQSLSQKGLVGSIVFAHENKLRPTWIKKHALGQIELN